MAELNHFNFLYRQYFTLVKVYKKCVLWSYFAECYLWYTYLIGEKQEQVISAQGKIIGW